MKPALYLISAVMLTVPFSGGLSSVSAQELPIAPKAPYDQELYGLSYDVFLANGNPAEAFLLAEKAVAARPRDPAWRRKAAQSAEWSGNTARALDHWYVLATEFHQQDAVEASFRLARGLGDGTRLKFLLEKRGFGGNPALLREYVAVCERSGLPEAAIGVLEKQRGGADRKYALEQLARLYEATGRHKDAIAALLDKAAAYGIRAADLLRAAALAYGSGDVLAAYTVLNLGKQQVPQAEQEYWQTFGDLAWALQDFSTAGKAAGLLVDSGAGREVDYQRLIVLSREKNPDQAFEIALQAWKRLGREEYLITLLELGTAQKRFKLLVNLIHQAQKSGSLKTMEDGAYYWQLVAQVYRGAGDTAGSLRSYQRALALAPGDNSLAEGYLWLLLETGQREELYKTLEAWKERLNSQPDLYDAYAAAYSYLGEYAKALIYFQARYAKMRNDPSWLAGYADTLEQSGWPEPAFMERLQALHIVRKRIKASQSASEADRRSLLYSYARLAMRGEPGEALDRQMQKIMRSPQDTVSRELVLAWAMSSSRGDFGRIWYWREFARLNRRTLWVELSLALEDNDRPRIMGLLKNELQRLPYRDAVEGSVRAGWSPVAETHAFERFQTNDRDNLLDQQLRLLYGGRPGGFRYGLSLIDQDGVGFMEQRISQTFAVTPRYSLRIQAGNTDIRHLREGLLGKYVSSIQTGQLGLIMRHERGTAEFTAGAANALYQYASASAQTGWRVNNRLALDFALLMGSAGTESVYMKIGGIKDEARVGILGVLTPRDMISLRVSGQYLRDQKRRELGQGIAYEGELNHRLTSSWPDITLRAFGGYHHYSRTGTPTGRTLSLTPDAAADAAYYVPATFTQAGAGLSFGQEGRTNYLRQWQPFASADTSWISTTGIGFHYEIGLVGPVFGLDRLEWSFSQDSGSFGINALTTRTDLLYRYYFK